MREQCPGQIITLRSNLQETARLGPDDGSPATQDLEARRPHPGGCLQHADLPISGAPNAVISTSRRMGNTRRTQPSPRPGMAPNACPLIPPVRAIFAGTAGEAGAGAASGTINAFTTHLLDFTARRSSNP